MEKKKILHGTEIIELSSEEAFLKYKSKLYDFCKKYEKQNFKNNGNSYINNNIIVVNNK